MKNVIIFVAVFLISFAVNGQEKKEMSPEQKVWMEYMTPGEMHKYLAKNVGEYKTVTTFWETPGAEPFVTEGKSVSKMIMGGRYLQSQFTGNMMGMPYEGMSLDAYDNALKKFYTVWIDNFGTGMMTGVGTFNEEENAIHYEVEYVSPMDRKTVKAREIVHFIDDNNQVIEMFMTSPTGEEWKGMVVKLERIK